MDEREGTGEAGEEGTVLGRIHLDLDPLPLECLIEMISTVSPWSENMHGTRTHFLLFFINGMTRGWGRRSPTDGDCSNPNPRMFVSV